MEHKIMQVHGFVVNFQAFIGSEVIFKHMLMVVQEGKAGKMSIILDHITGDHTLILIPVKTNG